MHAEMQRPGQRSPREKTTEGYRAFRLTCSFALDAQRRRGLGGLPSPFSPCEMSRTTQPKRRCFLSESNSATLKSEILSGCRMHFPKMRVPRAGIRLFTRAEGGGEQTEFVARTDFTSPANAPSSNGRETSAFTKSLRSLLPPGSSSFRARRRSGRARPRRRSRYCPCCP